MMKYRKNSHATKPESATVRRLSLDLIISDHNYVTNRRGNNGTRLRVRPSSDTTLNEPVSLFEQDR